MSIAAAMIAKDEEAIIGRAITSLMGFVDAVYVFDTGSNDETRKRAAALGAVVKSHKWSGFADARTAALGLPSEHHKWVLTLDADMTVEAHEDLRDWLLSDPDPEVGAWLVTVLDGSLHYRLPLLTRGGLEWRYEGVTHEALVPGGRKQRALLGLTVKHHADGSGRADKHARDIELLAPGVAASDPRSTYYTAQALWCLGREEEAAEMYQRRAALGGWDEEAWHATYMAARILNDVDGLVEAWRSRTHRAEPLEHAARLVRERGTDDILFLETGE
jgi:hypothetical protein